MTEQESKRIEEELNKWCYQCQKCLHNSFCIEWGMYGMNPTMALTLNCEKMNHGAFVPRKEEDE